MKLEIRVKQHSGKELPVYHNCDCGQDSALRQRSHLCCIPVSAYIAGHLFQEATICLKILQGAPSRGYASTASFFIVHEWPRNHGVSNFVSAQSLVVAHG